MNSRRKIFVVGPPRSGTHFVASEIAKSMGIPYLGEQGGIWRSVTGCDDYLKQGVDEISDRDIRKIRKAFEKLGGESFVEKTPSNCLRTRLIKKVFPDALIIFVLRDGRNCVASTVKKLSGDPRKITSGKSSGNKSEIRHLFRYKIKKYIEHVSVAQISYDLSLLYMKYIKNYECGGLDSKIGKWLGQSRVTGVTLVANG